MVDISPTLIGSSARLNADDLSEAGRIITVTNMELSSDVKQPLAIHYEGENGKPYYPCTTMRRVIAHLWGIDGSKFRGRQLHVFRDPTVRFAKEVVGGIRIKGASHIEKPVICTLVIGRGKKGKLTIKPLGGETTSSAEHDSDTLQRKPAQTQPPREKLEEWVDNLLQRITYATDVVGIQEITKEEDVSKKRAYLRKNVPDLEQKIIEAIDKKISFFNGEVW